MLYTPLNAAWLVQNGAVGTARVNCIANKKKCSPVNSVRIGCTMKYLPWTYREEAASMNVIKYKPIADLT